MPNGMILCPSCFLHPAATCICRFGYARGRALRDAVQADDQAAKLAGDAVRASIGRGDRAGARRAAEAGLAARRTPGGAG